MYAKKYLIIITVFKKLVLLSPVVFLALYLIYYSPGILYYDSWLFVPLAISAFDHNLLLSDLMGRQNWHVSIVTPILVVLNVFFFNFDLRFFIFIAFAIQVLNLILFKRGISRNSSNAWIILFVITTAWLSLRNWENLLAPWAINGPIVTLCIVGGALFLERQKKIYDLAALCLALIGFLTFSNGILILPILALYAYALGRIKSAFVFLAFTFLIVLAHLFFVSGDQVTGLVSINVVHATLRFFAVIAQPFSFSSAIISGSRPPEKLELELLIFAGFAFFILVFLILFIFRVHIKKQRLPVMLIIFSLSSCLLIAVMRGNLAVEQALSSRYYINAILTPIGLIIFLFNIGSLYCKRLAYCLAFTLFIFSSYGSLREWEVGKHRYFFFESWKSKVISYETSSNEELANPHFSTQQIRQWAAELKLRGLYPFSK
jgi:hypothetical protein